MNKVVLSGNLTKDMDVEITSNDKIHGIISLANNVGYGDNQKTNFIICDIYGNRVDTLSKYLLKGTKVLITGQLNINNVEREDGWKTYVNVYVEDIEILKFVEEKESPKQNKSKKYKKK